MRNPTAVFGLIAGSLLALAVGACSTTSATTVTNDATTTVAGAEVALTAAEHVALTYTSQPLCPTAGPAVWSCRDPATVTLIKNYDNIAYKAVKDAESGVATVAAAMAAINALTTAVPVT